MTTCDFAALAFFILWFSAVINAQNGQITVAPSNVTTTQGGSITLTCQHNGAANDYVEWKRHYDGHMDGQRIWLSKNPGLIIDPSKYDVQQDANNYKLIVKNVVLTDGFRYTCWSTDEGKPHPAEVVVLDPPIPNIPPMVSDQSAALRCVLTFGSSLTTRLQTGHRPRVALAIDNQIMTSIEILNEGNPGKSYHTIQQEMNYTAISAHNGKNVTCRAYTDTPPFEIITHDVLDVKFVVRNIQISPQNEYYYPGEKLNCSAEGNPTPTYQWTAITSPGARPVTGPVLLVLENMIGENSWKCTAQNTVHGTVPIEATHKFNVQNRPSPTSNPITDARAIPTWAVGVAIGVPALIIIIVAIIGIIVCCKRRSAKKKQKQPPQKHEPTKEEVSELLDSPGKKATKKRENAKTTSSSIEEVSETSRTHIAPGDYNAYTGTPNTTRDGYHNNNMNVSSVSQDINDMSLYNEDDPTPYAYSPYQYGQNSFQNTFQNQQVEKDPKKPYYDEYSGYAHEVPNQIYAQVNRAPKRPVSRLTESDMMNAVQHQVVQENKRYSRKISAVEDEVLKDTTV